ncbi:glutamine synthetase family protein [Jatrophihabitans sp. YIM 134969]
MSAADELTTERREAAREHAMALMSVLAERGVAGVATTYVDTSGITRVKAVPLARLPQASQWGIGMSPVFDAFLTDDSIVAGRYAGGPIGDLRLHPDLDRLVVLDQQPGWAWAPCDRYTQDGTPHPFDARSAARHAVAALGEAGLTARMAFEVEWAIGLAEADGFVPAVSGPAYGFTRLTERSDYLRDVLVALERQGVKVEQIHPEYSSGQFELSVAPEDPVAAADTLVLVKETVRAASLAHGLKASFSPKMVAGGAGNGGHVHLSVWRDDRNLFAGGTGRFGLQDEAVAFAGGILHRLPALLAIGAPSPASYLRLIPQHWAGSFQAWGRENRETALRLVTGSRGSEGSAANLEVKAFDLAANPYLVVASLLYAGLAGIADAATLPEPVDVDPASLSESERAARGIAALPSSVEQAVVALEADAALTAALGPELVATIADVRRGEAARFADASDDDVVAALLWVF